MACDQQREKSRRDPGASVEHVLELSLSPHSLRLAEAVRRHSAELGGRNGEAFTPLGAATLENQAAVFCGHARQEAVSLLPAAAVGLKSALHVRSLNTVERLRRNLNTTGGYR